MAVVSDWMDLPAQRVDRIVQSAGTSRARRWGTSASLSTVGIVPEPSEVTWSQAMDQPGTSEDVVLTAQGSIRAYYSVSDPIVVPTSGTLGRSETMIMREYVSLPTGEGLPWPEVVAPEGAWVEWEDDTGTFASMWDLTVTLNGESDSQDVWLQEAPRISGFAEKPSMTERATWPVLATFAGVGARDVTVQTSDIYRAVMAFTPVPPVRVDAEPPAWVPGASSSAGLSYVVSAASSWWNWTPPRYRFVWPGGQYRLRQRQTLPGSDGWPLRQRQNGAHSGSWPIRQRQTGV